MFSRIASRLTKLSTQLPKAQFSSAKNPSTSNLIKSKFSTTSVSETVQPIITIPTPGSSKVFPPSANITNYQDIKPALEPYNAELMAHPIYNSIKSLEQCQVFMESHAFAVWDFMTLLKSLQINLTSVTLPWTPPANPELAYFINSIVSGEESDDLGTHSHEKATSHYDLYLASMKEVGSSTDAVSFFVNRIRDGDNWRDSLNETKRKFSHIPTNTFDFVEYTMYVAENGTVPEIAASFLFGREDPIPHMFEKLLAHFNEKNIACPNLKLYLARHIEVDGDSHGPMADLMLGKLCTDVEKCEKALKVSQESIKMRIHLWDGIYSQMK